MGADALHAFFQQHLLMGVYPMAPMPKNDHSILPGNATLDAFYTMYSGLFAALAATCAWDLRADPLQVVDTDGAAILAANVFQPCPEQPGPAAVVIVSAGAVLGTTPASFASLAYLWSTPATEATVEAWLPGDLAWHALPATVSSGGVVQWQSALRYGGGAFRVHTQNQSGHL
jgi:hypothetical protein